MFHELNVDQLKAKAKAMKIHGYANMKKAELLDAVEKAYSFNLGNSKNCPITGEDCDCEAKADCAKTKAELKKPVIHKHESSSNESDLENHPKFAKFKTGEK